MIVTTVQVRCNACGAIFDGYDGSSTATARTIAEQAGWATAVPNPVAPRATQHWADYCPVHTEMAASCES